ncbi:hypothetical protein NGA84_01535 [Lactococcus formosensis]|uniref:Uncharacterized protein n=1 Tax=Lactococcus formosensis TaxID=1281486 RepID=A0A9X4P7A5_9LACT|nr:hypothetical protein [Lactococcus formosensis]MDG6142029.1 hypothetical protein [Lactococcus formosensis]MDG6159233.1 hypothetical protein [Lactococcus formosensis]MDG6165468.1 hypothetical protein [Lactococcus formosensis]MDG6171921.1 hypothetical protein [Lactococcus formosensis]MDG6192687.1 hypothetical protein [Lactococcus formosensis]
MIEDIKEKKSENTALITMILDEITSLYQLESSGQLYEINRLENALVTSLYMLDKRVKDIDKLIDQLIEAELHRKRRVNK